MIKKLSLILLLLLPLGVAAQEKDTLELTVPPASQLSELPQAPQVSPVPFVREVPPYRFYASNPEAVVRGMRYEQLKSLYNEDDYNSLIDPRYRTGLAWLNLLLPGVGQYVMGEPGRGTYFLLTGLGGGAMYSIGAVMSSSWNYYGYRDTFTMGQILFWSGFIVSLGCEIASIIDGYHVAHVKSLYTEDLSHKRAMGMSLSMVPLVQVVPSPSGTRPVPGLGLSLQF